MAFRNKDWEDYETHVHSAEEQRFVLDGAIQMFSFLYSSRNVLHRCMYVSWCIWHIFVLLCAIHMLDLPCILRNGLHHGAEVVQLGALLRLIFASWRIILGLAWQLQELQQVQAPEPIPLKAADSDRVVLQECRQDVAGTSAGCSAGKNKDASGAIPPFLHDRWLCWEDRHGEDQETK